MTALRAFGQFCAALAACMAVGAGCVFVACVWVWVETR